MNLPLIQVIGCFQHRMYFAKWESWGGPETIEKGGLKLTHLRGNSRRWGQAIQTVPGKHGIGRRYQESRPYDVCFPQGPSLSLFPSKNRFSPYSRKKYFNTRADPIRLPVMTNVLPLTAVLKIGYRQQLKTLNN